MIIKIKECDCLIDNDDFDKIKQFEWKINKGGHAVAYCRSLKKRVFMHRIINRTPYGMDTDHINQNPLDNRKCNLRTATRSENVQNKNKFIKGHSVYKGVTKDKKSWIARIGYNNKKLYIGRYKTEKDAAIAYNQKALALFGCNAYINNIAIS